MEDAIRDSEVGRETPRAHVEYKHDKVPEPRYFKEILENSLSNTEVKFVCEYFIRLLHYGTKQHKEKVLCLIGQPNSGKTSLFAPISRIIPERWVCLKIALGYIWYLFLRLFYGYRISGPVIFEPLSHHLHH